METRPYGTWSSPISAELVASAFVSFGELASDGNALYFLESRPSEKGRTALMIWRSPDDCGELTSELYDVRSMVHEYGGGAYAVANGEAYFVNKSDQDIYQVSGIPESRIERITNSGQNERFADLVVDANGNLVCVRELHHEKSEPKNDLVHINSNTGEISVLHHGHDFYASPRISPDGNQIVFLAWDHPNMPWDGTQLYVGSLKGSGRLVDVTIVAGGTEESIVQPIWLNNERFAYVSDSSGYWNIYTHEQSGSYAVTNESAEYGFPLWSFGMRSLVALNDHVLLAAKNTEEGQELVYVDCVTQLVTPCINSGGSFTSPTKHKDSVFFICGLPDDLSSLVRMSLKDQVLESIRTQGELPVARKCISIGRAIKYDNSKGETVHANYYPPTNPDMRAPSNERPPLLVLSHGGPTSKSSANFSFLVQFFATRGWAVLDVNYGGSTGYGREYRNRLRGQWGIVDVMDCVAGVRFLVSKDLVDPTRVAIRGGSAGGFTTLRALTTTNTFKAGASYYGVADVRALVNDTHKFESRYIDNLIPADEIDSRSPIHDADHLSSPVVFYQGTEDAIVPPNQSKEMFDSLSRKGITTALFMFEGEGHGFRMSENICLALQSEYVFFARVFGIESEELRSNCFEAAEVANAPWL
ncbi:MAG: prolyl oligopeptidase family serine peptidase [Gammaproteobacteria bacterium]|nr:prolyl oligopeptidase family serine peptidase [Gammaproteobacteria bacterium]